MKYYPCWIRTTVSYCLPQTLRCSPPKDQDGARNTGAQWERRERAASSHSHGTRTPSTQGYSLVLIPHWGPTPADKTLGCKCMQGQQWDLNSTALFFRFRTYREKRVSEGTLWHMHSPGNLINTAVQKLSIPFLKCFEAKTIDISEFFRFQSTDRDPEHWKPKILSNFQALYFP